MIIKSLLCLYCWALNKTIPGPPKIILNVLEKKCMPFHFFMKIKWSASLFRVNWFHVWPFPICNILENNFSTRSILKKKKLLVHFAKRWYRIGLDQTMLMYSLLIKYIKALLWLFSHYLFIAKSGELFNKKKLKTRKSMWSNWIDKILLKLFCINFLW